MRPTDPDLTIDAVLRDPLIRAVMAADRITPTEFEHLLRVAASGLETLPHTPVSMSAVAAPPDCGLLSKLCLA